jgi:hypothetical protein
MKLIYLLLALYIMQGQYVIILAQPNNELTTIEKDVCPFEGCQFGEWISRDKIKVYEKEGDTTSIKYMLTDNDTITALYGNVHYERFGKVLITKSFNNFIANDTITVLRCVEGEFIAYYNGEKTYIDAFWPVEFYETDDYTEEYNSEMHNGIMIERPQIIWWVKIVKNGIEGWLRLKNITLYCFRIKEKIDGMDSLG